MKSPEDTMRDLGGTTTAYGPEAEPKRSRKTNGQGGGTEPWPEPVDILSSQDSDAAPILTERHIPPALWPFVADCSQRMGVATSSVALCSLVTCSAAISEDWRLQPKRHDYTWTERSCLWGAIIGDPSIMKTPVVNIATKPIEVLDMIARRLWQEQMDAYQIMHDAWKEDGKKGPQPKRPRCPRYIIESISVESLQEVLRDDARGELYAPLGKVLSKQDELGEFLAGMDKYSTSKGGDRYAYIRLYNGGRAVIDRITRGSFVAPSWSGCILGGIQPEPIQRIAADAQHDGLIQRFILDVPASRDPGEDRPPNRNALAVYNGLFEPLTVLRPSKKGDTEFTVNVVLHNDAHTARENIDAIARAMILWPDASPQLRATFGKWPGLFARLCLAYHLIEIAAARARQEIGPHTDVVSAETAERVRLYMVEVLAPMLLRGEAVMFASRQTTHASWIARYILARKLDRVAARDIVQDCKQLRSPEQREVLENTMDSLCTVGWLLAEPPRGGKPKPSAWQVNPAVHERFAPQADEERARRAAVRADIETMIDTIRKRKAPPA